MPQTYPYSPYRQQVSVGIPYQPMYDPTRDNQTAELMMMENQKAMQAIAGVQEQAAATGDLFSYDQEGKSGRLSEFKNKTNEIKERFGNDLALAAPALSQAIVEERSNPWYQKNALYSKEYERRQQLQDKFGPNLITVKDLPQGNLNNMSMEDITYQGLNRQHLYDMWNNELGGLADTIRSTGLSKVTTEGIEGMLQYGNIKGLTEAERAALVGDYTPVLDQIIESQGLPDTAEMRSTLAQEFNQWTKSNLVKGQQTQYRGDPAFDADGRGVGGGNFKLTPKMTKVDEVHISPTMKDARTAGIITGNTARKTGVPMYENSEVTANFEKMFADNPQYAAIRDSEPTFSPEGVNISNGVIGGASLTAKEREAAAKYITEDILRHDLTQRTLPSSYLIDPMAGMAGMPAAKSNQSVESSVPNNVTRKQQKHLKDNWEISINETDPSWQKIKNDHSTWTAEKYRPFEESIVAQEVFSYSTAPLFMADSDSLGEVNTTVQNLLDVVNPNEFTYFDEDFKQITSAGKGHKTFEDLETNGFTAQGIGVIIGDDKVPFIITLTMRDKDNNTERIRISPNSANDDELISNMATTFQSAPMLHAARSRDYITRMKNDKLYVNDVFDFGDAAPKNIYIKKVRGDNKNGFVITDGKDQLNDPATGKPYAYLSEAYEDIVENYVSPEVANYYFQNIGVEAQLLQSVIAKNITPSQQREEAKNQLYNLGQNGGQ